MKPRCLACHCLAVAGTFCDLCLSRVPLTEKRVVAALWTDNQDGRHDRALCRWTMVWIQDIQLSRLADHDLLLNDRGPGGRLSEVPF